jgi:hypothetical protein
MSKLKPESVMIQGGWTHKLTIPKACKTFYFNINTHRFQVQFVDMIRQRDLALILVILEVGFFLKDFKGDLVGRAL